MQKLPIPCLLYTSGDEGLKTALEENFDLIVLDLMLPGIDGFEICKKIREVKNIPIIMVSAKKDDIDKIRGLGLGADDYMTKPFSPSELVARVKAQMCIRDRSDAVCIVRRQLQMDLFAYNDSVRIS